jgi:ferredoxin-NADP reductase
VRWLVATVAETVPETPEAVTLYFEVEGWTGHRAGQHVDIRLTAEDGYSTERSYSIASPPEADRLELTVVRLEDGEVSPYLTSIIDVGDQMELRGPIGGYFVWEPSDSRPVLLVGGGSGVIPLMSMMRHHAATDHESEMSLIYSARTQNEVLYGYRLEQLVGPRRSSTVTLTRESSAKWAGRRGRVDSDLLVESGWPPEKEPHCYVCGPTPFVEAVADALVSLGHQRGNIKTERFGPTGGY